MLIKNEGQPYKVGKLQMMSRQSEGLSKEKLTIDSSGNATYHQPTNIEKI